MWRRAKLVATPLAGLWCMVMGCSSLGRHAQPPGLAFGEPDDRLHRGIQYSVTLVVEPERHGVLDRPLSRTMTLSLVSGFS